MTPHTSAFMKTRSFVLPQSLSLSMPSTTWVLATIVGYACIVRALRYRRINGMVKRYGYTTRERMAKMTDQEAYDILQQSSEFEFPSAFEKALQLALFRTYGIPSISKLLVETSQLSKSNNVGKRYADTQAIFVEIFANAPSSDRAIEAYARLNYLHGHYIKAGKITNDDMLYTLALFMTHPVDWINRVEWRQLTELEVCASGVFYKGMGDAMETDFGVLPSANTGFKDGLQFYQELDEWAKRYEERYMLPHKDNYTTALQTRNLLLTTIPEMMHPPVMNLIHSAMDDRLRHAVMFDDPTPFYHRLLNGFFAVRKYYLRHLSLPRRKSDPLVESQASASGRRNFRRYETVPLYVKPTLWNRWGPGAWVSRFLGLPLPGDAGMMPEGFITQECGPRVFFGKGAKEFDLTKAKLKGERTGGCPFAVMK